MFLITTENAVPFKFQINCQHVLKYLFKLKFFSSYHNSLLYSTKSKNLNDTNLMYILEIKTTEITLKS